MPKSFSSLLLAWYDIHKRDLPWRTSKDPYRVWVSEMMLQQTTVNTVISYYQKWFEHFPTVQVLAKARVEKVLKVWQGLGYYARARNLHKAAGIVVNEYGGCLPKDPLLVRKLPGFGPYATGAVLSIAYDLPLTIIDANVRRVIMRILCLKGYADVSQDAVIEDYLKKVFPKKNAGDFNQALMELGALVCKPKDPLCDVCPVNKICGAYKVGCQNAIPVKKDRKILNVHAVIALIEDRGKYFIQKRKAKGLLEGMWEFPGGKVEAGEDQEVALAREIREELGVGLLRARYLFDVVHFYTQYKVRLSVYRCDLGVMPRVGKDRVWAAREDFKRYPLPAGTKKILDKLGI